MNEAPTFWPYENVAPQSQNSEFSAFHGLAKKALYAGVSALALLVPRSLEAVELHPPKNIAAPAKTHTTTLINGMRFIGKRIIDGRTFNVLQDENGALSFVPDQHALDELNTPQAATNLKTPRPFILSATYQKTLTGIEEQVLVVTPGPQRDFVEYDWSENAGNGATGKATNFDVWYKTADPEKVFFAKDPKGKSVLIPGSVKEIGALGQHVLGQVSAVSQNILDPQKPKHPHPFWHRVGQDLMIPVRIAEIPYHALSYAGGKRPVTPQQLPGAYNGQSYAIAHYPDQQVVDEMIGIGVDTAKNDGIVPLRYLLPKPTLVDLPPVAIASAQLDAPPQETKDFPLKARDISPEPVRVVIPFVSPLARKNPVIARVAHSAAPVALHASPSSLLVASTALPVVASSLQSMPAVTVQASPPEKKTPPANNPFAPLWGGMLLALAYPIGRVLTGDQRIEPLVVVERVRANPEELDGDSVDPRLVQRPLNRTPDVPAQEPVSQFTFAEPEREEDRKRRVLRSETSADDEFMTAYYKTRKIDQVVGWAKQYAPEFLSGLGARTVLGMGAKFALAGLAATHPVVAPLVATAVAGVGAGAVVGGVKRVRATIKAHEGEAFDAKYVKLLTKEFGKGVGKGFVDARSLAFAVGGSAFGHLAGSTMSHIAHSQTVNDFITDHVKPSGIWNRANDVWNHLFHHSTANAASAPAAAAPNPVTTPHASMPVPDATHTVVQTGTQHAAETATKLTGDDLQKVLGDKFTSLPKNLQHLAQSGDAKDWERFCQGMEAQAIKHPHGAFGSPADWIKRGINIADTKHVHSIITDQLHADAAYGELNEKLGFVQDKAAAIADAKLSGHAMNNYGQQVLDTVKQKVRSVSNVFKFRPTPAPAG